MSDSNLATTHEAGATVMPIQLALHERYGTISFEWTRYWPQHFSKWRSAHDYLASLDGRLAKVPLESSNIRHVPFLETPTAGVTGEDIYLTGADLVVHAVLTVQYLTLEIERVAGLPSPSRKELTDRYARAAVDARVMNPRQQPGWSDIVALHKYRDAVVHPTPNNVYASGDGRWAEVPLAWFGSGKALASSRSALADVTSIIQKWEVRKRAYDRPGTITIQQRGLRSLEQAKKPPV